MTILCRKGSTGRFQFHLCQHNYKDVSVNKVEVEGMKVLSSEPTISHLHSPGGKSAKTILYERSPIVMALELVGFDMISMRFYDSVFNSMKHSLV